MMLMAELQEMADKGAWHGVHVTNLTSGERKAVIRSSMCIKDKCAASGAFYNMKDRLVTGGDQQYKWLHDNLSSSTASTTSVMAIAAIAARKRRSIMVIYIGGAFLNADITSMEMKFHMRLNKMLTVMLVIIRPEHSKFMENKCTSVVQLDNVLDGCVETAAFWYTNMCFALMSDGFAANPCGPYGFSTK
jgi:hypothetical protein